MEISEFPLSQPPSFPDLDAFPCCEFVRTEQSNPSDPDDALDSIFRNRMMGKASGLRKARNMDLFDLLDSAPPQPVYSLIALQPNSESCLCQRCPDSDLPVFPRVRRPSCASDLAKAEQLYEAAIRPHKPAPPPALLRSPQRRSSAVIS